MEELDVLKRRLKKIGISISYMGNYPWIYVHEINGELVTERHASEYGFTIGYLPIRFGQHLTFTDLSVIFKLIRKYSK